MSDEIILHSILKLISKLKNIYFRQKKSKQTVIFKKKKKLAFSVNTYNNWYPIRLFNGIRSIQKSTWKKKYKNGIIINKNLKIVTD